MRKLYFEPEMKISTFSAENVVTTSVGLTRGAISNTDQTIIDDFNSSSKKATIAYNILEFNF